MAIQFPTINGMRYDFSSVEINLDGVKYVGVKDVSFTHSLKPTHIRGTSAVKMGRTRGVYDATAKLTMYEDEAVTLIRALNVKGAAFQHGFMEVSFLVTIVRAENGKPPIMSQLHGCRITDENVEAAEGGEALVRAYDLDVMKLLTDTNVEASRRTIFF